MVSETTYKGVGLGSETDRVRIDLYGSSGDYLASGIDGLTLHVHGNAQGQVGQIMKRGKLVIHGDVGQAVWSASCHPRIGGPPGTPGRGRSCGRNTESDAGPLSPRYGASGANGWRFDASWGRHPEGPVGPGA